MREVKWEVVPNEDADEDEFDDEDEDDDSGPHWDVAVDDVAGHEREADVRAALERIRALPLVQQAHEVDRGKIQVWAPSLQREPLLRIMTEVFGHSDGWEDTPPFERIRL